MPLKAATGNMFGHVTHNHTHLGGECPHRCTYCYVPAMSPGPTYKGAVRMRPKELTVDYGTGKTIFVEHCTDLFAAEIPDEFVRQILAHCCQYPDNDYLFHTKNPARYADYLAVMPPRRTLGTTAETNRPTIGVSVAPPPLERLKALGSLSNEKKLVTIEPVLKFDFEEFFFALRDCKPDEIVLGADSKHSHLSEPTRDDLIVLEAALRSNKLQVTRKTNLARLM